jgi:hypothetical protein
VGDFDLAMMRGVLVFAPLISVLLFPWPFSVLLALASSFVEPLTPLAAGLFADTLYYTPQAQALPLFTIGGAALSAIAFLVRSRLKTSIIGE